MDRFDCQYLMATFVNVYISSFIRVPSPQKLFQHLVMLDPHDLRKIYENLGAHLQSLNQSLANPELNIEGSGGDPLTHAIHTDL